MQQATTATTTKLELIEPDESTARAIAPAANTALAVPENSPVGMMLAAMARGASLEQVEKMMDLQERWERREAEKAFTEAMAEFKKNPPELLKTKLVEFDGTRYMHAVLGEICELIVRALADVGISHRWKPEQAEGTITITCILTHKLGHSEGTPLKASPDSSGKKNPIQALMSAKTYLERHSLLAACGLAPKSLPDDDGRGGDDDRAGPITEAIFEGLLEDLKETRTDEAAALLWASGSKTLAATGHKGAYQEFKEAVVAHRQFLRGRK